jgi:VWFA-related protein
MQAAHRFLDRLAPDDLAALYVFPYSAPAISLTHDHRAVGRAVDRLLGDNEPFHGMFHLGLSEMFDITANDGDALRQVAARECLSSDTTCPGSIRMEAMAQASYYEGEAQRSLAGLSTLLAGLAELPDRKTVVLLSGGLVSSDRAGSRPDLASHMTKVGAEAAASDAGLYVVDIDDNLLAIMSQNPASPNAVPDRFRTLTRDADAQARGLERLAGSSGGTVLRVNAGTADGAFSRILRESQAYYLVGVQPTAEDRDGQLHFLNVKVKRRGVTVRSRTHVVIPKR